MHIQRLEPLFLPWWKLNWCWTLELSPPRSGYPQVTTDPSAKIAAKDQAMPQICWTFLSRCWTPELAPPEFGRPQVTGLSAPTHHKANASHVAATFGYCAIAARLSPSWSRECRRKSFAGNGGARKRRDKPQETLPHCCAAIFKSAIVPFSETATVSHRPLGKDTSSFMKMSATWPSTALRFMAKGSWPDSILWRSVSKLFALLTSRWVACLIFMSSSYWPVKSQNHDHFFLTRWEIQVGGSILS